MTAKRRLATGVILWCGFVVCAYFMALQGYGTGFFGAMYVDGPSFAYRPRTHWHRVVEILSDSNGDGVSDASDVAVDHGTLYESGADFLDRDANGVIERALATLGPMAEYMAANFIDLDENGDAEAFSVTLPSLDSRGKDFVYQDIDASGSFDLLKVLSRDDGEFTWYAWFNGAWNEVARGYPSKRNESCWIYDEDHVEVTHLMFNHDTGEWESESD